MEYLDNPLDLTPRPVTPPEDVVRGSTEIVTLDEARAEWNKLRGTHLEAHRDGLTAEQARQVNDTYDTEVYVGTHGPRDGVALDDPRAKLIQYDAVAALIKGMQPGDTLFVEGFGFTSPTYEPDTPTQSPRIEEAIGDIDDMTPLFNLIKHSAIGSIANGMGMSPAELGRQSQTIDAWSYAEQLATERGITVVYADLDAFQVERFMAIAGGKSWRELSLSADSTDRAMADRIDTVRVQTMCNIVKDWAVDHLPSTPLSATAGRKPRLIMLEGRAHRDKLVRSFVDMDIRFKLRDLSKVNTLPDQVEGSISST